MDNVARDLFLGNVKEVLHDRSLDYIIVNHMEPDHSGSLLELAKRYPEAKICATPAALKMFEQYFHEPMAERYIRTNEKLVIDLGHHKMRFIPAPMVHWPEVTFTYEETERFFSLLMRLVLSACSTEVFFPMIQIMKKSILKKRGVTI